MVEVEVVESGWMSRRSESCAAIGGSGSGSGGKWLDEQAI
jgi:hypothetical protein